MQLVDTQDPGVQLILGLNLTYCVVGGFQIHIWCVSKGGTFDTEIYPLSYHSSLPRFTKSQRYWGQPLICDILTSHLLCHPIGLPWRKEAMSNEEIQRMQNGMQSIEKHMLILRKNQGDMQIFPMISSTSNFEAIIEEPYFPIYQPFIRSRILFYSMLPQHSQDTPKKHRECT